MKKELFIAKIGGSVIEDKVALAAFLKDFSKLKGPKLLVHGGGKSATQLATKLHIPTTMVEGRRVTTAESLDIAVMTYAGLVNKTIVVELQKNKCNALGFTGADANTITAIKRPIDKIDYGFVGDVIKVNDVFIDSILQQDIAPIFCAITHDKNGQLLNTNADTIASKLAVAMSKHYQVSLFYCFELQGVLTDINDKESVIEQIDLEKYQALKKEKVIADGMLPKLQNCFDALQNNVVKVHIANADFIKNPTIKHTTLSL